jgi:hypothetical protein
VFVFSVVEKVEIRNKSMVGGINENQKRFYLRLGASAEHRYGARVAKKVVVRVDPKSKLGKERRSLMRYLEM